MNIALPLTIRPLQTLEDAEACEDLQVSTWPSHPGSAGFSIPIHMLMAQMELSGSVIGAWDGDRMVGFLYGSKEMDEDGRLYHYSCCLCPLCTILKTRAFSGVVSRSST